MFKKYTLPNGLRVLLAPMHETKAITVLVLVKVGSRFETRRLNGVSHFVEHLMFKGTKKRPDTLTISRELDEIGAEYNAFTSKDHTGYYVKASAEHTTLAFDMLSDILFNSQFDRREVERERGVIIEEINMYEDNPLMLVEDVFESTVYGDHPLGWNIAGPKQVIQRVSRADLFKYYQYHYQPANMLVVAAGRLSPNIRSLVTRHFSQPTVRRRWPAFKPVGPVQRHSQVRLKKKETEQAHLALGFPAFSYFNDALYPLYLLSVIMGGTMSSRLFISIRERKGLCYFIRSSVNVYEDTGNLMIQAGLDKTRIKEAITEILKELRQAARHGVTAAELKKAKEFLKGKLVLDLESSDSVAAWLSKQELLRKRVLTPVEQIKRLEAVSLSQVQRVAADVIQPAKVNLSLIGPFTRESDFRSLLKF